MQNYRWSISLTRIRGTRGKSEKPALNIEGTSDEDSEAERIRAIVREELETQWG